MSQRLLIVRHAERPPLPQGEVGNDLSLTENGIHATKRFAKALNGEVKAIYSSPILRCIQTAQLIADEHCIAHSDIQTSCLLGDPGFFIADAELAWQNWLDKGSEAVNAHLLAGIETWPGFHAFDQAIASMRKHLDTTLALQPSGLVLWITHDTILATLASRLLPAPLTMDDWPDFLGYLEVSCDSQNKLVLNYTPVLLAAK